MASRELQMPSEDFAVLFLDRDRSGAALFRPLGTSTLYLERLLVTDDREPHMREHLLRLLAVSPQTPTVLIIGSHLGISTLSLQPVLRVHDDEGITEAELENLISQALWKSFEAQRRRSALLLRTVDFETVLADVRIPGVKINGHRVINPLGFSPRTLETSLLQTFVVRSFFDELERSGLPRPLFIVEAGALLGRTLSRTIAPSEPFFSFFMGHRHSVLTRVYGDSISPLADFQFGSAELLRGLEERLALSPGSFADVLDLFVRKEVSSSFYRRFEAELLALLRPSFAELSKALGNHKRARLFCGGAFPFSSGFWSASFRKHLLNGVSLHALPQSLHSIHNGYTIHLSKAVSSSLVPLFCAGAVEAFSDSLQTSVQESARRRALWLSEKPR